MKLYTDTRGVSSTLAITIISILAIIAATGIFYTLQKLKTDENTQQEDIIHRTNFSASTGIKNTTTFAILLSMLTKETGFPFGAMSRQQFVWNDSVTPQNESTIKGMTAFTSKTISESEVNEVLDTIERFFRNQGYIVRYHTSMNSVGVVKGNDVCIASLQQSTSSGANTDQMYTLHVQCGTGTSVVNTPVDNRPVIALLDDMAKVTGVDFAHTDKEFGFIIDDQDKTFMIQGIEYSAKAINSSTQVFSYFEQHGFIPTSSTEGTTVGGVWYRKGNIGCEVSQQEKTKQGDGEPVLLGKKDVQIACGVLQ